MEAAAAPCSEREGVVQCATWAADTLLVGEMWRRILSMAMAMVLLRCTRSVYGAARVSRSDHTNNWAVLVDTSRFWYNYRHASNTLTIYRHVAVRPPAHSTWPH